MIAKVLFAKNNLLCALW